MQAASGAAERVNVGICPASSSFVFFVVGILEVLLHKMNIVALI